MDFDKTIGVYLENTEWKGRTDIGCLLNGCRQMYAATQDERYQKFILQYVEKMSEEWENACQGLQKAACVKKGVIKSS